MSITSTLRAIEVALGKGDYAYCIELLEPLSEQYASESKEGTRIQSLLITAYMGQGKDLEAINICKVLAKSRDQKTRQNAKQLINILDSPKLPRPSNWSINIPTIQAEPTQSIPFSKPKKNKGKQVTELKPPTGTTKDLGIGFSLFVLVILIILTFILSA